MEIRNAVRAALIALILIVSPAIHSAAYSPYYGATFSLPLITSEPPSLYGYQLMFDYDPELFKWRRFNVYFDGGISHFWVTNTSYYSTLNIYSVAPVIRYTFKKRGPVFPFLELSIGLAYLNHTHLDDRNLGMHFAFQDRMGLGVQLGSAKQVSIGLHAVHYSNAHLCGHNSGVTVPLELDLGYRFN